MKSSLRRNVFVFGCFSIFVSVLWGQNDAQVGKVASFTADGVVFEISLASTRITQGDDIVVNVAVRNASRNQVQLIRSTKPPAFPISDLWVIHIPSGFMYPDAHSNVDYAFVRIGSGRTFRSTVRIPAKVYVDDTKYSFENAAIEAHFLYIVGAKPPEECEDTTYSLPCLYVISKKAKQLTIGRLVLDIPDRK